LKTLTLLIQLKSFFGANLSFILFHYNAGSMNFAGNSHQIFESGGIRGSQIALQ